MHTGTIFPRFHCCWKKKIYCHKERFLYVNVYTLFTLFESLCLCLLKINFPTVIHTAEFGQFLKIPSLYNNRQIYYLCLSRTLCVCGCMHVQVCLYLGWALFAMHMLVLEMIFYMYTIYPSYLACNAVISFPQHSLLYIQSSFYKSQQLWILLIIHFSQFY